VDELESVKPVPVTTRARVFCVRWRRQMCLAGMPYRMELASSSLEETRALSIFASRKFS